MVRTVGVFVQPTPAADQPNVGLPVPTYKGCRSIVRGEDDGRRS